MTQPSPDALPLIQQLLAMEQELTTALMVRPSANAGPLPDNESLGQLKAVIDRLRPLLWIHLNRAGAKQEPLSESALMKTAASAG